MSVSNQILDVAVILLAVATLVGIVTRRLRLPYTVGLVLIGLSLGLINREHIFALPGPVPDLVNFIESSITPEFILGLLVTPLIFEAALHLNWNDLKRNLGSHFSPSDTWGCHHNIYRWRPDLLGRSIPRPEPLISGSASFWGNDGAD